MLAAELDAMLAHTTPLLPQWSAPHALLDTPTTHLFLLHSPAKLVDLDVLPALTMVQTQASLTALLALIPPLTLSLLMLSMEMVAHPRLPTA